MYEGSAKEITEADFNAALKFGQEAIQPMIAAQKELAARVGKTKRQITLNIVPEEILKEAKALAGDRIVTALLTPGQTGPRSRRRSASTDEIGKKLVEKFGAEKVTEFVLKDAFYYIQKEAVRGLIMNQGKRLDGRDFDDRPPDLSAKSASCRGRTVRRCSSAAKPRPSPSAPSAPAKTPRNSTPTPAAPARRNSSCTTTSRTSPSAKPAASAARAGARSATAPWPSVRSSRWCRSTTYPYAIRITSEIMESNGSTSMASRLRRLAWP